MVRRIDAEIDLLKHLNVMIGNLNLGQKSRLRREGISMARGVVRDLLAARLDKVLATMEAR